ncbi:hypothetical protein ABT373_16630 [Streptomyces sp. NPDC000070]|uniref:hypothetical protein n=1 Tax=Streptomyces sp. NPDC000070 TaxID=3154240 RepID=UPI00332C3A0D
MTQLRCGVLFAAISVPGNLVRAKAEAGKPEQVDAFLAETLQGGPVIYNRTDHYYALTSPSIAARWQTPPDAYVRFGGQRLGCLGDDRYLGVPAPGESDPCTAFIAYWSVPVAAPGELCDSITVLRVFNVGDHLCGEASA